MTLVAFCQLALRAGSSRGLAYSQYVRYHGEIDRDTFETAWASARALETAYGRIRATG